ncbi:MAG: hypothetical protein WBP61_06340 [Nocardioides sp.]
MILVPRQIQMTGMTGNVPYYGGRLTPAQARAAAHPATPAGPAAPPPSPAAADTTEASIDRAAERVSALRGLLEDGVITREEFDDLIGRVIR